MKRIRLIVVLIVLFYGLLSVPGIYGQENFVRNDTIAAKQLLKRSIIPVTLITIGAIASGTACEQNLQENIRNRVGDDYEFHIDDYFQYVPIVQMYIADAAGMKSRNHWFDQTKYLLISNIITASITHGLKSWVNKTRPNGGSHSFPSGHTTFAFTNAAVLCNEFKQTSPWFAYSGYAFAATTGTFRMLNNKHWLSDVLFGAGIGILVTNIVYYFEPLKSFNPFKSSKDLLLIPQFSDNKLGLYFSYKF